MEAEDDSHVSLKKPLAILAGVICCILGFLGMFIAGIVGMAKDNSDATALSLLIVGGLPFALVLVVVVWNVSISLAGVFRALPTLSQACYFFCCCNCWKERYREITF